MVVNIAVVYHSVKGHTEALAEAVGAGVSSVDGVMLHMIKLDGAQVIAGRFVDKDDLVKTKLELCDGIIFGSPTYMGSLSAVLKAFFEWAFVAAWINQRWKDKWSSGFTNSASQSGDKLNTLMDLTVFAAQMGMIWVPLADPPGNNTSTKGVNDINRLGSWLGVMGQSNGDQGPDLAPLKSDRLTAEHHGARFARMVKHWKREGDYVTEYVRAD